VFLCVCVCLCARLCGSTSRCLFPRTVGSATLVAMRPCLPLLSSEHSRTHTSHASASCSRWIYLQRGCSSRGGPGGQCCRSPGAPAPASSRCRVPRTQKWRPACHSRPRSHTVRPMPTPAVAIGRAAAPEKGARGSARLRPRSWAPSHPAAPTQARAASNASFSAAPPPRRRLCLIQPMCIGGCHERQGLDTENCVVCVIMSH